MCNPFQDWFLVGFVYSIFIFALCLLAVVLSVLLRLTVSDYSFWYLQKVRLYIFQVQSLFLHFVFWLLYYLSFSDWRFLITHFGIFKTFVYIFFWLNLYFWTLSFGSCFIYPSPFDGFWLLFWYVQNVRLYFFSAQTRSHLNCHIHRCDEREVDNFSLYILRDCIQPYFIPQ